MPDTGRQFINSKPNGIRQTKHLHAVRVQIALCKNVMTTHLPIETNKVNSSFHAIKLSNTYLHSHIGPKNILLLFHFFVCADFDRITWSELLVSGILWFRQLFLNVSIYIWIQKRCQKDCVCLGARVRVKAHVFLKSSSFHRGLDRCGQSLESIYDQNRHLFVLFCAR